MMFTGTNNSIKFPRTGHQLQLQLFRTSPGLRKLLIHTVLQWLPSATHWLLLMLSDPEKIAINTVFVCFLFHVISWFNILTLPRIIYTVIHSAPRLSLSGSHQVATGAESLWSLQFGDFSELCPSAFPHNGFNGLQDLTPRNHIAQNLWSSKSLQTWKSGLKGVIVHNPWIQTLLRICTHTSPVFRMSL